MGRTLEPYPTKTVDYWVEPSLPPACEAEGTQTDPQERIQ